ncbi:unnamed protein product, partial [marine sediment metagenome]
QNENIPPSLPDVVDEMALLLAKVIVKQGSNTLIVQNVEYFAFSPDISVDHNELQGLQGGTADEYYHMTAAEHTLGAAIMALTPTDGNFIVGDGATWVAESGATVRTSLGLGTGDTVTFANLSSDGTIASGGDITAAGDLIPTADDTYDIGLLEASEPEYTLKIEQALYDATEALSSTRNLGFTFTPATSYDLGKIELYLTRDSEGTGNVTLHIRATAGGLPTGEDLTSVTIDGATISDEGWEWVTFQLAEAYTFD